ncbi:DUF6519 domain-containing protein [Kutzneria chonburiensis]|uniref:DUF6519 domain-containing protein n=1 Tax=Kutzneria chonburiensis TaxID=1483604 RepID=A0ABV6MN06_9PSEU|nr:DUF6519 domain-containing protein [Kutzneria chonburiensis]
MGDFSRSTFDRVKHYVGVRLQQGVPLVDADWNELEDIRRFEVQAFLKWFVGDGVPAGNDGFRITAAGGGGVNTIVITSRAVVPANSTLSIDVPNSTAAAALGFTVAGRSSRRLAPATLVGENAAPFALAHGMTLTVVADGVASTVTFQGTDFANIAAATAAEVVTAINKSPHNYVATAGTGNDFVITGGDGTPERAGRCLADGRDAVHEGRLAYTSQSLYANDSLAQAWKVPVVPAIAPPGAGSRTDLVYLDVWDREVNSAEDGSLINPVIGVETSVRLRREWAVRVRVGSSTVPVKGDSDFFAGHSYLALSQLVRQFGVPAVPPSALSDLRPRSLLMPPSTLVEDMLGGTAADYRLGRNRPQVNLRDSINALLAGFLPPTRDISVAAAKGLDLLNKASVVDADGGVVAVWQTARGTSGVNQIIAARYDPNHPELDFQTAFPITSGATPNLDPAAVALPTGEVIITYQNGNSDATTTDVMMKRGPLASVASATEQAVSATSGGPDQMVRAVLVGDQVVFFVNQGAAKGWFYRRYKPAQNNNLGAFVDSAPVALAGAAVAAQELHTVATAGGFAWVAFSDGSKVQAQRFNPLTVASEFPFNSNGTADKSPFVLPLSDTDAFLSYIDGTGILVAQCTNGVWSGPVRVDSTTQEISTPPALLRDAAGTICLISTRNYAIDTAELLVRRRDPLTGTWSAPQRVAAPVGPKIVTRRPYPLTVPNQGLWLLFESNRAATDFDIFAKQLITVI